MFAKPHCMLRILEFNPLIMFRMKKKFFLIALYRYGTMQALFCAFNTSCATSNLKGTTLLNRPISSWDSSIKIEIFHKRFSLVLYNAKHLISRILNIALVKFRDTVNLLSFFKNLDFRSTTRQMERLVQENIVVLYTNFELLSFTAVVVN